ncbi:MAG: carboxylesterase/lipase family protein, partial [Betaproteobacteria bacterium]
KGLFRNAIIQSASSLLRMATVKAAQRNTHYFLNALGLTQKQIDRLQDLPAQRLLEAMPAAVKAAGSVDNFRPLVDERALPAHPFDPSAPALSIDVPLMIGWCETELRFTYSLTPEVYAISADEARARVARLIGIAPDEAERLLALYGRTRPADSPGDLFALIHSDHQYRRNNTRAAELKAAQGGAPVYMYEFTWRTPVLDGILRTPHTLCIPFAFGNCDIASGITGTGADRYPLQEAVMGAWIAFARDGAPNHAKLPRWQPFRLDQRATMMFDTPCGTVNDPAREERLAMQAQPAYEADAGFRR